MAKTHRILVVDDDPNIRKLLERILAQGPFEVACAADGQAALDLSQSFEPALAILDNMMPGMSGVELCQNLRKKFSREKLKILMLSAKDSQSDRLKALELGADDYINKPFHVAALVRKIEHILQNP